MRHRYECPLRWADLDLLGHVNNVKYVDYLQEARGALLRTCLRAAGVEHGDAAGTAMVVVRHEVTFAAPLLFRRPSVSVDSWVSSVRAATFTLEHEVYDEQTDGSRTVYLRARTVLAPFDPVSGAPRRILPEEKAALAPYVEADEVARPGAAPVTVDRVHAAHYPVQVRFSDVDVYRHVNNVKYVEYFQESRIALFRRLKDVLADFPRLNVVVAQTDLDYLAPVVLREDPYDVWTTVTAFGNRSMTIDAELTDGTGGADGGRVLARARVVLVLFDLEKQASVPAPPGYREAVLGAFGHPGD